MMEKKMKKSIKILSIISATAVLITAMGFGCGIGWQPVGLNQIDLGSRNTDNVSAGDNGDLVIVSGQRTTSVALYDQVLANMLSVTGIDNPRQQILDTYTDKVGSLSENGSVLTVNAPMLLAFSAIGSEVCSQAIAEERALAVADRKLFGAFLEKTNINQITETDVKDVSRRLARTFWQRNETGPEMQMIVTGMNEMIANNQAGRDATVEVNKAALFLCTGMIASASTYEM